ncbi:MAG: sugar ABC transporter substrate-binding protein, partial [Spirochaetaceae bacterium]
LFYDRFDPASFERLTAGLMHQSPDGVILAPSIETAARGLVERIDPRMVVLIDGDLPDVGVLTTISQDSIESGLLAGKLLDLLCPNGGRLLSVTVGVDDHHLQLRRKGFERYFAAIDEEGTPKRLLEHLVIADTRDWASLDAWFAGPGAAGPEGLESVAGIFVTNAAAHEVVARLPAAVLPRIVGYDLIPENARALQEGTVDFIINQQPENQGYQALVAIHRARVMGEPVSDVIRMPIDIVMRENLDFHPLSTG